MELGCKPDCSVARAIVVYCGELEFVVLEFFAEFCPPAPVPLAEALGPMALLRVLAKIPLEAWTEAHFEQPVVVSGLFDRTRCGCERPCCNSSRATRELRHL